jgi:hypothetical protein
VAKVRDAAKEIMRQSGNMHQWGEGYPSEAVIFSDIKKNITLERSKIVLSPRFHVKLS